MSYLDNISSRRKDKKSEQQQSVLGESMALLSSALTKISIAKGEQGEKGKDGKNGIDGKDGKDGRNGKDGKNGKSGKDGRNGLNGKDGLTPIKGVHYYDGKDGVDGKDGDDGKSAYEIAVQDGFTGSEAEWLKSLKGQDGVNTFVTNGKNPYATVGYGKVKEIKAGANVTVDNSDPENPTVGTTGLQPALGYTPVNKAGDTMSGRLYNTIGFSTGDNTLSASLISNFMGASRFTTSVSGFSNYGLNVVGASNSATGDRPIVGAVRSRGTLSTPLAVVNGDEMFSFLSAGYDGTGLIYPAEIKFIVNGTVSTGAIPTRIGMFTGSASASRLERLTISPTGLVGIGTTAPTSPLHIVNTSTLASGVYVTQNIAPTINQSSTAGYTALLINPTETTTGSGAKNLIDAQVGGVGKFKVDNLGIIATSSTAGVDTEKFRFNRADDANRYNSIYSKSDSGGSATISFLVHDAATATSQVAVLTLKGTKELILADGANIVPTSTTGTKIGTSTGHKIAFWNATPIVQQAHIADPTGGATVDAEARTAINSINALLATLGLTAAS